MSRPPDPLLPGCWARLCADPEAHHFMARSLSTRRAATTDARAAAAAPAMMPGEMWLACTVSVPAGVVVAATLLFVTGIGARAGSMPEDPVAASTSGPPAMTALKDGGWV